MKTQDFLYGLALLKVGETEIGYIEENSFDLGGQAGEVAEVNAAQVKGCPVLVIPKKNGTIKPSFDLIQIIYENLVKVMGGKVIEKTLGEEKTAVGWEAPSELVQVTGEVVIQTDSGHKITIPKCQIAAYLNDKLSLEGVAKIHIELTPLLKEKNTAPYKIENVEDTV